MSRMVVASTGATTVEQVDPPSSQPANSSWLARWRVMLQAPGRQEFWIREGWRPRARSRGGQLRLLTYQDACVYVGLCATRESLESHRRKGSVIDQSDNVTSSELNVNLAIVLLGAGPRTIDTPGGRDPVDVDSELTWLDRANNPAHKVVTGRCDSDCPTPRCVRKPARVQAAGVKHHRTRYRNYLGSEVVDVCSL